MNDQTKIYLTLILLIPSIILFIWNAIIIRKQAKHGGASPIPLVGGLWAVACAWGVWKSWMAVFLLLLDPTVLMMFYYSLFRKHK